MITCYLSFSTLPGWLCLDGLAAINAATGVEVHLEPMLATLGNPTPKAAADDPLAEYKARRARARANFRGADFRRMCERLGVAPEAGKREGDMTHAALGVQWLEHEHENAPLPTRLDYVRSVYARHFREGGDVTSVESVASLIEAAGASANGFADFAARNAQALQDSKDELIERGILRSPAFVVEGEIYLGREHLPLIGWILGGRVGHPPV